VQDAASKLENQDEEHVLAFTRLVALLLSVQTAVALAKQQPGNKRVFVPVALLMSALYTKCGLPESLKQENVDVTQGNRLQRHAMKTFRAISNNPEALRNLNTVEELSAAARGQVDSEYYFGVTLSVVGPSSSFNGMECAAESFSSKVSVAGNQVAKFIEGSAALLFMAKLGVGITQRYHPLQQIQRILSIGSSIGEQARRDAKGAVGAVGAVGHGAAGAVGAAGQVQVPPSPGGHESLSSAAGYYSESLAVGHSDVGAGQEEASSSGSEDSGAAKPKRVEKMDKSKNLLLHEGPVLIRCICCICCSG